MSPYPNQRRNGWNPWVVVIVIVLLAVGAWYVYDRMSDGAEQIEPPADAVALAT